MIQVFDSWAGELSPASFQTFSEPYLRHIATHLPPKLQALGLDPVPMIVFPKGAWYALGAAGQMGYNVVGMDWTHDPAQAVATVGREGAVLQGNADPGVLYGSREAITEVVETMFKGFDWHARKRGWIVNLGHGGWCTATVCAQDDASVMTIADRVRTPRYHPLCQARRAQVLL